MSENHRTSQVGKKEKLPSGICTKTTSQNQGTANNEFVLPEVGSGHKNETVICFSTPGQVSPTTCDCYNSRKIQPEANRVVPLSRGHYCLLVVCLTLVLTSLTGNYLLWMRYEDLKASQNELQRNIDSLLKQSSQQLGGLVRPPDDVDDQEVAYDPDEGTEDPWSEPEFGLDSLEESEDSEENGENTELYTEQFELDITYEGPNDSPPKNREKRADNQRPRKKNKGRRNNKLNKNNRNKNRKQGNGNKFQPAAFHMYASENEGTKFDGQKFIDWKPDDKGQSIFDYSAGSVTVNEAGLYFVYAQVTYHTSQLQISFSVYREKEPENEQLFTCVAAVSKNETQHKSCYSAMAVHLQKNDKIYVSDEYGKDMDSDVQKMVNFAQPLTFWGLIKLAN